MKYSFFAPALRMLPFPEILKWAGANGFDSVELWPTQKKGEGAWTGSFINCLDFDTAKADEIKGMMKDAGLNPRAITFSANMMDPAQQEGNFASMRNVIDTCSAIGGDVVGCWAGRDFDKNIDENIKLFGQLWPDLCKYAADKGIKLAMENCPLFWAKQGLIGNIAISPHIWEQLFNEVQADNLGLNFDPSHMYWMQLDIYRAIKEFKDKIFWFHAKDCEIDQDRLAREGNIPFWDMTWRYRLPGFGNMSWAQIMSLCWEHGYHDTMSLEYEDMVYGYGKGEMDANVIERGLLLAKKHLQFYEI